MGIKPPKGVILYGVPGTGKTLLAKAVANQTSATFLRVVGSELIQKYLGDGPKLVREMFRVAEEHAPSIVFIDEIDAIGTKRYVQCVYLFLCLDQWSLDMIQLPEGSVKFSGRCWNYSINSMASTRVVTSKSLWLPTGSKRLIQLSSALVV
jgi:Holliday junction resolvasome RuvABC ATP-dependent DNA helicase subunit